MAAEPCKKNDEPQALRTLSARTTNRQQATMLRLIGMNITDAGPQRFFMLCRKRGRLMHGSRHLRHVRVY